MSWYDTFARFYDVFVERVYRPYREQAAEVLDLAPASRVLDLACGTGQNFDAIMSRLGPEGRLVGVDFSAGMLAAARRRIARRGWTGVTLIQRDARELEGGDMAELRGAPDRAICALGLSVIPDWEKVLEHTLGMLEPGGLFVIFDIHAERRVPQSWWVEKIARADLSRKSWEVLERLTEDFTLRRLEGSPHVHGGRPFIASGRIPTR